jgi:hypothetical protein
MSNAAVQFIFLFAFIIPALLFIYTQYTTLKLIDPSYQSLSPGLLWLQLIPVFVFIWQFFVVSRLASSIKRQLNSETLFSFENGNIKSQTVEKNPTYGIGITYCILFCCSFIPLLGVLAALAAMVCWIIYWVQLAGYKGKIKTLA